MSLEQIESIECKDGKSLESGSTSLLALIESRVNEMLAGGDRNKDIYGALMAEVEPALINAALKHAKGNQSRAAILLGLSRGTLRKRIKSYGIGSS